MLGAGKEGGEWARQGKGSDPETNNQKPSKRGQTSKKPIISLYRRQASKIDFLVIYGLCHGFLFHASR